MKSIKEAFQLVFIWHGSFADKDAKYATMLNEYGCKIMTIAHMVFWSS
jgi:hypothetical protein